MGNLKSWQPGVSGNPNGRPKGSRNIRKLVQTMLEDPNTFKLLPDYALGGAETPLEAIICATVAKAMAGDIRATDIILKYAVDDTLPEQGSASIFDTQQLVIRVVNANGELVERSNDYPELTEAGMLPGDES